MNLFYYWAARAAILVCLFSCSFIVALGAHSEAGKDRFGMISKANAAQTPLTAQATPTPAHEDRTPREERTRAYAKLLEGQRYLSGARSLRGNGELSAEMVRSAQQAFQQAAALDPALAEAHTALAEIALYSNENTEQAEREALAATRIDPNSLGAHRILSRLYTLKSGLREDKLDRANAEKAITELREVTRLNPGDAEAWALQGELYSKMGREREAIEAFRNWAAAPSAVDTRFFQVVTGGHELAPDAAAARLGEALLQTGRAGEAVAAISRAIAASPDNKTYLALLDKAIESAGSDDTEVIAELQRLVAANPTNTSMAVLLARAESRAGHTDEAVAALQHASEISSKQTKGAGMQLALQAEEAQIFANALRYDEAIAAYEELLKTRGIGNTPLSSRSEKQVAAFALGQIINLQQQAGRSAEALATVERMRRLLGADNAETDRLYIVLLREQGKKQEALAAARAASQKYPDEAAFPHLEAATLADLGHVDEAAGLLRARLRNTPEDFNEYLALADLYRNAGRGREAVEAARKALELAPSLDQPELVTQALLMLSAAQERAGDTKGSEESLRRILAKEPDNATALNNFGYYLVERNERLPEALEMIRRAVRAEPYNPSYIDSLGWAYYKLGQLDEAERYLSEAARRNPASPTIQEHLGDLYNRRGKTEQAHAAWRKALSLTAEAVETGRLKAKLNGESYK